MSPTSRESGRDSRHSLPDRDRFAGDDAGLPNDATMLGGLRFASHRSPIAEEKPINACEGNNIPSAILPPLSFGWYLNRKAPQNPIRLRYYEARMES